MLLVIKPLINGIVTVRYEFLGSIMRIYSRAFLVKAEIINGGKGGGAVITISGGVGGVRVKDRKSELPNESFFIHNFTDTAASTTFS